MAGKILKLILITISCLSLCSCEAMKNLRESDAAKQIGSFHLNPVQPDNYWYNGSSYEYNSYEIQITSVPVNARIEWNGKIIGTTPFTYKFSGTLDTGERINVRAFPISDTLAAQESVLKVTRELPREIHFDFNKKGE